MDEELPICDVSAYFEKDGLSLKDIFPDLFGQPENLQQHPPTAGDSPPRVDEFGDSSNQNRISEENEHGEEEEEEEDDISQILINEKLRVLQELVPNCNKTDQALVLDDVIEYLAAIKLQVEAMYARMGRFPFLPMMPEIGMGNPMFPFPAASDDQPLLPLAAGVNPISEPKVLPTPAPNPQLQMPLLPSQQYYGTSIARPIYITNSPPTLDHLNEGESSSQNLRSISNISQHGSMISQREIVPATRVVSPSNINMMENVVAEDPQLGKEAGNEDPVCRMTTRTL